MRIYLSIFCVLLFSTSYSQIIENEEKIKSSLENYFQKEREIIHVHFNKNTYLNNESIGFKGYIINKNTGLPFVNSTNIQMVIYNEKKEIIQKQLFFAIAGTFDGVYQLSDKFKPGKYQFHFFTNWMNNFKEDDSFIQSIQVFDKNEPYNLDSNKINFATAKVTFFPESGVLINGVNNKVGITIKDCNQNGIAINEGVILDSKLHEVTKFSTNKMGNGNFNFTPITNEKYTVKTNSNNLNITEQLPTINENGLKITYNNNLSNNHLAISVNTNLQSIPLFENKKLILLIHQDANSVQKAFSFSNKEPEQILDFDKKYLSEGVNTIRVIDENLKEIAQRLVFIGNPDKSAISIEAKEIENDSISISGKTDIKNTYLSVSILPSENECINQQKSILGTYYLNSQLEHPGNNTYSYFDIDNKNRKNDLELLMLNQKKSKYKWEDLISEPEKSKYRFSKGVTIYGKVEKKLNPKIKYKLALLSLKDKVFDETSIDENNEFKFENYYAQDSTVFMFQLLNEKKAAVSSKMNVKIIRNDTLVKLPINFDDSNCPVLKVENNITFSTSKSNDKTINLNEVKIQNNYKKEVFTHKDEVGSFTATAYKIDENSFGNVLEFIGRNGYRTGISAEDNSAFIKNPRNGALMDNGSSPAVYIDNELVFDLNLLYSMFLTDVDEIYIDKNSASSFAGTSGTINIYLKKGIKKNYYRTNYDSLIVTNGYAVKSNFVNSTFESQKEFYAFGTLDWQTLKLEKEEDQFKISFPKGNQSEIKLLIEGFNSEGKLFSEIRKVPVSKKL
jgi:hypothetical protein